MQSIALPKKIEVVPGATPNQADIIVEPLNPGYGATLGNSLRRVLLASLPGSAVIGVKIAGVDHEFMAIPHVKEDILQMILNLKQLRFKYFSEEPVVRLELEVHGEKQIKAGDIKKNAEVQVVNPDLVLANITDMAGKLEMEIFVSRGLGYEQVENRENKASEIGYIEIDSIFSPILNVALNVENTRVGKMTDWDKLVLSITTDGTIEPQAAFAASAKILVEQFNAVVALAEEGLTVEAPAVVEVPVDETTSEAEVEKPKRTRKKKADSASSADELSNN